ncbi:MAG: DUF1801 domain-containing protein [Deferribacteres bacterium]|nr:DUF1801 domain-containing protein [candidate division KSB1 bacterium]MCB9502280.1 DUF1801 domain-containing protein [Deferribacteres bacterium]
MNNSKSYKTVHHYFECQPEATKKVLQELRSCILEAVPDAEELINYNIPAFALVKNGKRDQQIMIAGYAKHVGLYPHPTAMEHFSEELKGFKQGKGSVQFPLNVPLPKELIIKMVLHRKMLLDKK